MPNTVSVNYRRLKTTASQATLELTTSTLTPEGPHRALLLDISTGSIYREAETFVGQPHRWLLQPCNVWNRLLQPCSHPFG